MKNADKPINTIISQDNIYQALLCSEFGLTKREYFAGLAMQGILSSGKLLEDLLKEGDKKKYSAEFTITVTALIMVDELLKQLENENI